MNNSRLRRAERDAGADGHGIDMMFLHFTGDPPDTVRDIDEPGTKYDTAYLEEYGVNALVIASPRTYEEHMNRKGKPYDPNDDELTPIYGDE